MKKTFIVMMMIMALALSTMAGAFANARWDSQVTGGVTWANGAGELDVAARTDGDVDKGQLQYTTSALEFHVAVDCFYQGDEGYAFSGPTNVQNGSTGEYANVEISNDGKEIRVRGFDSPPRNCGYSGDYKADVDPGYSFNIR